MTPTPPRCEDMRLVPSLNITPEGSLVDLPVAVCTVTEDQERKKQLPEEGLQEAPIETANMGTPNTCVKTKPESTIREVPRLIQRTKEASREEAITSTQQFFVAVDRRNTNISTGSPTGIPAEVHERDVTEVPNVSTSSVVTTPVVLDVEPRGASCPRISLPKGSPSHPTVTATCRPRTWMQQITEGQTNEPTREGDSDESISSDANVTSEEIPDELGREWRVLHPFELPEVRFLMDSTPPNQRRLAENDVLVELIQTTKYLDDVPMWGQRDYQLYPLVMVTPSTEEEVEEKVEVGEDESGFMKDQWRDQMED